MHNDEWTTGGPVRLAVIVAGALGAFCAIDGVLLMFAGLLAAVIVAPVPQIVHTGFAILPAVIGAGVLLLGAAFSVFRSLDRV